MLRFLRLETPLVLLGAFFINLCVICVFAQGFYGTGAHRGTRAAQRCLPCSRGVVCPAAEGVVPGRAR